jgi:hypothetical protein
MEIRFNLSLENESERPRFEKALLCLLSALVIRNMDYLRAFPATPALYRSGVRYKQEKRTVTGWEEFWKSIPEILRDGEGDCEDLSCYRVAELRVRGVPAVPFIRHRIINVGGRKHSRYHVMVRIGGRLEDPSRILGMGGNG